MQPSAARRARSERGEKIHGGGRTRNSFMVLGTSFRPFRRGVGRGNQFWEIKRIKEIALTVENSDVRAVELVGGTGEKIAIPIAHIDQLMWRVMDGIDKDFRADGMRCFSGAFYIVDRPKGI